jgi:hypothetical protein
MSFHSGVLLVKVHFRPVPIVHSANPVPIHGMYRPTLDMNWPDMMEQQDVDTISGRISAPDSKAVYPRTDWK